MSKLILAATALFLASSTMSFADEMKACDDATSAMIMKEVEGAAGDAKAMGMKELEMAKMSMKEGKMEDCSKHLGMAAEAVMKK